MPHALRCTGYDRTDTEIDRARLLQTLDELLR